MNAPESPSWDTPEKLAAVRDAAEAAIPGWRRPVLWAVGISPATSQPTWEFPVVNRDGGFMPAVVLGRLVRHTRTSETLPVSAEVLRRAVADLAPAEACPGVEHPNLVAWRGLLDEVAGNPARELVVVYVDDLADPVTSEADGQLRALAAD
ncbi:hypothetical protein [Arsenicicoccus dermatophilus]|uniref:hypothetical protein n=1 Tax=Arsenicicoccus dermatophilus TaxID=1076331 RepID=UPI003916D395